MATGLQDSPLLRPLRPLILLGAVVLVGGALAWARDVLMPIALATLLTFLLSPVANALERRGLGRAASVLVVVTLAFSLLAGAGWALSRQATTLGTDLPKYTAVVKDKVARWRREGGGRFLGRMRSEVEGIVGELEQTAPPREKPLPVVVLGTQRGWLAQFTGVTEPLATAGLVALLVVFMLFERAELRNRLIRLGGYGRLTLTTKALDEAAERISRYLLGLFAVNVGLGAAFAAGVFVIGLPYALLWGALLAVLRFVPYVGVWIAGSAPVLFSIAVFDGWLQPLGVIALFVALETIVSALVEPVTYSHRAGLSKVALLVAIAVWTWLWGPVGLVLATPLTVCLLVLARHVHEMEFVAVLAGDEPALPPAVSYYQRLVAGDRDEAREIVEAYLEAHPVEQLYDDLLIPALAAARRDRASHRLGDDELGFVIRATRDVLEDVAPAEPAPVAAESGPGRVRVLGCPLRDAADEVAMSMFQRVVDSARFDVELISADVLTSEIVARVESAGAAIVCLAVLPPGGVARARYLAKRLRARDPQLGIVVGRWGPSEDGSAEERQLLLAAGADHVSGQLLHTRDDLSRIATSRGGDLARSAPRADQFRGGGPMKATDILKKQHKEVKGLFKQIEKAEDADARRRLMERIGRALELHTRLEEEIFYPAVRELGSKKAEEMVAEAFEEHHVVDLVLKDLPNVDPEDERFEAKMTVLSELILHHVEEEEREMFKLADRLGKDELEDLGEQMTAQMGEGEQARRAA